MTIGAGAAASRAARRDLDSVDGYEGAGSFLAQAEAA